MVTGSTSLYYLFMVACRRLLSTKKCKNPVKQQQNAGADPGFFLGGGALISCSTSTPINHIVFFCFLQNTSCIRKPQVISRAGAHPLHPPPRSAPGMWLQLLLDRLLVPPFISFCTFLNSHIVWSNPTHLIQTPHYYGQFALFLGKESPYIFSKFNPPYPHPIDTDLFMAPAVFDCTSSRVVNRLNKLWLMVLGEYKLK